MIPENDETRIWRRPEYEAILFRVLFIFVGLTSGADLKWKKPTKNNRIKVPVLFIIGSLYKGWPKPNEAVWFIFWALIDTASDYANTHFLYPR